MYAFHSLSIPKCSATRESIVHQEPNHEFIILCTVLHDCARKAAATAVVRADAAALSALGLDNRAGR